MADERYDEIKRLLAGTRPAEIRQGLTLVKQEIARVGSQEARPLFELVSALFYYDPLDHPELVGVLDEAVSLVVGFGEWVIPVLLESIEAGDMKAQLAMGHALGRLGADAVEPLMEAYRATDDPERRTFAVYALGKIPSPKVAGAAPLVLEAAGSADRELRDTATRALGRMAEWMAPELLPPEWREACIARLTYNLADPSPSIRAKAMRSLGKLARHGHMTPAERQTLGAACRRILGTDENYDWDRSYVVRKEAEEALSYV